MTQKSTPGSYQGRRISVSGENPIHNFNIPVSLSWTDTMSGADSKNWRTTIRNGGNAVNPMSGIKHSVTVSPGTIRGIYEHLGKLKTDTYIGPPESLSFYIPSGTDFSNAERIAASELGSSVSDAVSEFKGLVAAAEASKTLSMISGRASALQRSFLDLNGTFADLRKWVRMSKKQRINAALAKARSYYLEYSYGWSPLMNDISSLHSELNKELSRSIRVSAVGTDKLSLASPSTTAYPGTSNCPTLRTQLDTVELSVRYVGAIDMTAVVDSPVPARFGFNHEEFIPTLYELIPWSFVIDYFTNLGQVINNYAYRNIKFRYLCKNTRIVATRKVTCTGYKPSGTSWSYLKNITGESSYTTVRTQITRSKVEPALPAPDFGWKIPSPLQAFNTAVLVSTLF